MKAIKQLLFDFRNQSVISWVTLIGTTLSVFLIMIVVMMQQIQVAPFAPESNRDRILYGGYLCVQFGENINSGGIGSKMAHHLYDSIPGVDVVSYCKLDTDRDVLSVKGKLPIVADAKYVDANFWKIFNHTFKKGNAFNQSHIDGNMKVAVITEKIARQLFGSLDVIDHDISVNKVPYKIIGVIKNTSSLAADAYGEIFIPCLNLNDYDYNNYLGNTMAYLLAKTPEDIPSIRSEVERRFQVLNSQDRGDDSQFTYFGQPYTQEMHMHEAGSNNAPTHETARKTRYFIFGLLLIIPAINLSSMTQSRLRRRISEIGVKRAFGCTRSRIISDLLTENFILTIVGGVLGLVLSLIFVWLFSDIIFISKFDGRSAESMFVTPEMVFNLPIFLWSIFFCLVLNILSAGVPAMRASRVNPVEAINMGNK